ncbi:hypothetical protein ACFPH6_48880 [Streptomyces xiangluensis]|uniref:Uncharacterized protein n=1 Tax=Streptomyces xiangluensis TaxID=2665720 RepID=A0ABV8Z5N7_9ACTN
MRHTLTVVLALTACAVLAGARSLLAVGEWIADVPPQVLTTVGAHLDPLCYRSGACLRKRRSADSWPGSTATPWTRPWAASSPTAAPTLQGDCARWRWTARAFAAPRRHTAGRSTCSRPGPHHRPGPGPARRAGEDKRDHVLPATAGNPLRPDRNRGHQRRLMPTSA